MRNFLKTSFIAGMILILLIAAGCSKEEATVQESLIKALEASKTLDSYRYTSNVVLDITLPESAAEQDPISNMVMNAFKGLNLSMKGVVHQQPEPKTEMIMDITIPGDMSMNIQIPMLVQSDRAWVKIPNIPMFVPETFAGKFIEVDFEELSELSGTETGSSMVDFQTQQNLGLEVLGVLNTHFAEGDYFQRIDLDEAGLSEEIDAEQVIQFSLTNENLNTALNTFFEKALPDILDIISKPEYAASMEIALEDLEAFKQELEQNRETLNDKIEEFQQMVSIEQLRFTMALDQNDYMIYQALQADVSINDEGETMQVKMDFSTTLSEVNENPSFELELPSEDEIMTLGELMQMFGGIPAM